MSLRNALLGAAAVTLALSAQAFAAPITPGSQLNIAGFDIGIGSTTIDQATGLDFTSATLTPSPGTVGVLSSVSGSGAGSFAGISCSSGCGSIEDIADFATFSPIAGFYETSAAAGSITFDLNSITNITRIAGSAGSLATLILSGTGIFHFAGFDPSPGIFTLTTQGGNSTTFSASSIATAGQTVPEPMTLAVFGAGLVGLGGLLRRRRKA